MSGKRNPVANSTEFRDRFSAAIERYQRVIKRRLANLQREMDPVPGDQAIIELEAHIRTYVVDPLLEALNWSTDDNLTIEALVRSQETERRRYLDYLGIEADTTRPLLVVEAKRPNAPRPRRATADEGGAAEPRCQDILAAALTSLKADPQNQLNLLANWQEWIRTLFDYVRSLPDVPVRVAMTNGEWLIVFEDPKNAFLDSEAAQSGRIAFYEDTLAILRDAIHVFESLNYNALVPFGQPIEPPHLPALVVPAAITAAMRALLVTFVRIPDGLGVVPIIHVVPYLVLFRGDNSWIRIQGPRSIRMPHDHAAMPAHLAEVATEHMQLMTNVQAALGLAPPIISLEQSFEQKWLGNCVPSVSRIDDQRFLVILGDETHFITAPAQFRACPFHSSAAAAAVGAALDVLIAGPSADHVTHFGDQSEHHCAHRAVRQLRENQVTEINRANFNPRGPVEDGPFCKLWGFERFLCCQTCAFKVVCKQSIAAQLPCRAAP